MNGSSKASRSAVRMPERRRRRSVRWWRRRVWRWWIRLRLRIFVHFLRSRGWARSRVMRIRFLPWLLITSLIAVGITTGLLYRHRVQWHAAAEALAEKGTLPSLEIAVGAAILGIIGIVFSLSIFSIQQAAERGTTFTLREYTQDWVFKAVYWTLAVFALVAMLSALQRSGLAIYRIFASLAMLVLSVVILRMYFDRVMKFVDPHFTISKVAKRAHEFLRDIEQIERVVHSEVRYHRAMRGDDDSDTEN